MCQGTVISKYFREYLGLLEIESQLYILQSIRNFKNSHNAKVSIMGDHSSCQPKCFYNLVGNTTHQLNYIYISQSIIKKSQEQS